MYVHQRAVLVGTQAFGQCTRTKPDGTVIRTLWGELAWQLAGPRAGALVAQSDESGHAPGADVLQALFDLAGPSLILIDEWVAFVRQLYGGADRLAVAGSFDANLTFAQNLIKRLWHIRRGCCWRPAFAQGLKWKWAAMAAKKR